MISWASNLGSTYEILAEQELIHGTITYLRDARQLRERKRQYLCNFYLSPHRIVERTMNIMVQMFQLIPYNLVRRLSICNAKEGQQALSLLTFTLRRIVGLEDILTMITTIPFLEKWSGD